MATRLPANSNWRDAELHKTFDFWNGPLAVSAIVPPRGPIPINLTGITGRISRPRKRVRDSFYPTYSGEWSESVAK